MRQLLPSKYKKDMVIIEHAEEMVTEEFDLNLMM